MSITFGPKLNRCYSLYVPFMNQDVSFKIFFHKTNTFMAFTAEQKLIDMINRKDITMNIYKDLTQSSFATTFLDIKTFTSPTLDVRCQFSNVQEKFKEKIQYNANETIKLAKYANPKDKGKWFESILYLYAFSFSDYTEDFLYVLAERQHIDIFLGKKLVRTSAFQLCNRSFLEDYNTIIQSNNGVSEHQLKEVNSDPIDSLKDLFEEPSEGQK